MPSSASSGCRRLARPAAAAAVEPSAAAAAAARRRQRRGAAGAAGAAAAGSGRGAAGAAAASAICGVAKRQRQRMPKAIEVQPLARRYRRNSCVCCFRFPLPASAQCARAPAMEGAGFGGAYTRACAHVSSASRGIFRQRWHARSAPLVPSQLHRRTVPAMTGRRGARRVPRQQGAARGAFPALLGPAQRPLPAMRARADGPGARRAARHRAGRSKLPRELRRQIDKVVSPAMGGVIIGHEMGRALGVEAMFVERPDRHVRAAPRLHASSRARRC